MDTVHECDRQTDRRTDRITMTKTVQRIASHGNNVTIDLELLECTGNACDCEDTVTECRRLVTKIH